RFKDNVAVVVPIGDKRRDTGMRIPEVGLIVADKELVTVWFLALVRKLDDLADLVLGVAVFQELWSSHHRVFLWEKWGVKDRDIPPCIDEGRGMVLLLCGKRDRQLPAGLFDDLLVSGPDGRRSVIYLSRPRTNVAAALLPTPK